ncbi:MAG: hypothetical protein M3336_06660 [Chloroflexota bacterium]|nr:hypothetical protein [Chloroflexota bacterium]
MELLIILFVLCALGPLAARFGYDSRVGLFSKEQDLGARGVTWAGLD